MRAPIYAQRHNRSGDADSWGTLLVVLRAYANSAEARGRRTATAEPTITPEQTLREAGIGRKRQAEYQRKMSTLLAGRSTTRGEEA